MWLAVELELGCPLAFSLKGAERASGLQWPTLATVSLAQGLQEEQGKEDHLLSMARMLKCEVLILLGFYTFLSRLFLSFSCLFLSFILFYGFSGHLSTNL